MTALRSANRPEKTTVVLSRLSVASGRKARTAAIQEAWDPERGSDFRILMAGMVVYGRGDRWVGGDLASIGR